MSISDEENDPEILHPIEELEPDGKSELPRRIHSMIKEAKNEPNELEIKRR